MFKEKLKNLRQANNLTQEAMAEKLNVSRMAISKWESGRGYPDIQNLIAISNLFEITLDELIKDDKATTKKIIDDSSSKKYHILVIVYLIAIIIYIMYFCFVHKIIMIGFLIATIFMLGIELNIFVRKKYEK